jgi:hypothetical protein
MILPIESLGLKSKILKLLTPNLQAKDLIAHAQNVQWSRLKPHPQIGCNTDQHQFPHPQGQASAAL